MCVCVWGGLCSVYEAPLAAHQRLVSTDVAPGHRVRARCRCGASFDRFVSNVVFFPRAVRLLHRQSSFASFLRGSPAQTCKTFPTCSLRSRRTAASTSGGGGAAAFAVLAAHIVNNVVMLHYFSTVILQHKVLGKKTKKTEKKPAQDWVKSQKTTFRSIKSSGIFPKPLDANMFDDIPAWENWIFFKLNFLIPRDKFSSFFFVFSY